MEVAVMPSDTVENPVVHQRSTYGENGEYVRIIEYSRDEDSGESSSQSEDDAIEYEDADREYDTVVVRLPPDADVFTVEAYREGSSPSQTDSQFSESSETTREGDEADELVYEQSFEMRDLSFDPISVIGRGETSKLTGTSPTQPSVNDEPNGDEDIPNDVETALNALGLAVVPNGEWWLNE
jgi:hypothetical protein